MSDRYRYRFGAFTLDPQARELRRSGELVGVQQMVFDGICYLIEHHERAVGRDELIAAVWGKADVTYSLLSQLVVKMRQAVGESGNDQRTIRTIPRFGYRWVAGVENAADQAVPTLEIHSGESRRIDVPKQALLQALLFASLAVAAFAGWFLFGAHQTITAESASTGRTSNVAAVLPVEVEAIGDWAWVRLGAMDLIGERLRNAGLAVVPSEDVVALSRNGMTSKELGEVRDITGARYVIASTALRKEQEWVVSLRLKSTDGVKHAVEARNDDVLVAAREASDHLLQILGRPVPLQDTGAFSRSDDELLARAKAALIAGELATARRLLESASEAFKQSPEWRRRMVQVDDRSNRLESAARRLDDLLKEVSAESTPQMRAALLNDSGVIEIGRDQPALAEQRFREALSLGANGEDLAQVGRAQLGLGIAYQMQGDYERFGTELARARVAYTVSGNVGGLASVEWNEGELYIRYNHYAAAKTALEHAAERYDRLGRGAELALAQGSRIKVALALLDSSSAVAIGTQALPGLEGLQVPEALHYFRIQWARALISAGRLTEARALLDRWSQDVRSEPPDPYFSAGVSAQMAGLDLAAGRPEVALIPAEQAADTLVLPDFARERLQAWLIVLRALRELGRDTEAAAETRLFSAWAVTSSKHAIAAYGWMVEAEQAVGEGRQAAVRELYEKALRAATEEGVPADIAEIAGSYGNSLLVEGDLDRASIVIGRVAGFAEHDYGCALLQAHLYHALGRHAAWDTALSDARRLAGERAIPAAILSPPPEIAAVDRQH
jgi:DNA-binding winged helix-turn-helix (wHTH) protein/tetratricopeptide (TPR) repeat protein